MFQIKSVLSCVCVLVSATLGTAQAASVEPVRLEVRTSTEKVYTLTVDDLRALPQTSFVTTTPWHDGRPSFAGPKLSSVIAAVGVGTPSTISLIAENDYAVRVPPADLQKYDPIIAIEIDGNPLTTETKGPLMIIYPLDSMSKTEKIIGGNRSVWYLKSIEIK